ncbi:hypothetical protein NRB_07480 [Novosphingobium sp. 11B]
MTLYAGPCPPPTETARQLAIASASFAIPAPQVTASVRGLPLFAHPPATSMPRSVGRQPAEVTANRINAIVESSSIFGTALGQ